MTTRSFLTPEQGAIFDEIQARGLDPAKLGCSPPPEKADAREPKPQGPRSAVDAWQKQMDRLRADEGQPARPVAPQARESTATVWGRQFAQ